MPKGLEPKGLKQDGLQQKSLEQKGLELKGLELKGLEQNGLKQKGLEQKGLEQKGLEQKGLEISGGPAGQLAKGWGGLVCRRVSGGMWSGGRHGMQAGCDGVRGRQGQACRGELQGT